MSCVSFSLHDDVMKDEMTNKPKAKKRITQQEYNDMFNNYDGKCLPRGTFDLSNLDLRDVEIDWDDISSVSLRGSILSGVSLKDCDVSYVNFSGAILDGPELLDVCDAFCCTFSEKLLPWISCHRLFNELYPSLTFVNEETGEIISMGKDVIVRNV